MTSSLHTQNTCSEHELPKSLTEAGNRLDLGADRPEPDPGGNPVRGCGPSPGGHSAAGRVARADPCPRRAGRGAGRDPAPGGRPGRIGRAGRNWPGWPPPGRTWTSMAPANRRVGSVRPPRADHGLTHRSDRQKPGMGLQGPIPLAAVRAELLEQLEARAGWVRPGGNHGPGPGGGPSLAFPPANTPPNPAGGTARAAGCS